MSLFLHICTGLGLALAAGIRPFMPLLAAGALARAHVFFAFAGSQYAFLQSGWFLLATAAAFAVFTFVRAPGARELLATAGVAAGGLLFAGVLAAHHDAAWPGLLAGVLAAGLSQFVSAPIFVGAARRLTGGAERLAVMLYAEAAAVLLALACWIVPPLSLAALALVARLAWPHRRNVTRPLALLRVPR
jgi:hypothetical protein